MLGFIRRRLVAKLIAGYLLAVVGATMGVGFFLTRQLEIRALNQLEASLATQARLMEEAPSFPEIRLEARSTFQALARRWTQSIGGRVTVIALDGTVVADSGVPIEGLPQVENHRNRPEVQVALNGHVGRSIRRSATVKQELFYVAIPVRKADSVVGVLRVALPLTSVHELTGTVGRTLVAGLAFTVIGIILVSALLSFRITRPLTAISHSAHRFAQGELDTRVPSGNQDEIGALGQAFNTMAAQLQARLQELEASRSQIEGILQGMAEGVLAVSPDGRLLLINASARQILGMGSHVKPGHPVGEIIRYPELKELIQEALTTGQPRTRDVTLYVPTERHLRVHATSCRCAPAGSCALLVLHDITDLRHLEQIRREFVANVSHELKTPLTAIRGAVETLLEGALENRQYSRTFVVSIDEESTRLGRLVEDLLTLAQVESQQAASPREAIPFKSFLETEIARYEPLAKANQVTLICEVASADGAILADRNQLAQAIGNLLDNAIKYNRPSGRVILRASVADRQLKVEVEDTGIGIPSEDLPRIFERFYRVDKARSRETGGTGLGLSIVKHVAEAHGGSVQVESQLNHGSLFTLILPLA